MQTASFKLLMTVSVFAGIARTILLEAPGASRLSSVTVTASKPEIKRYTPCVEITRSAAAYVVEPTSAPQSAEADGSSAAPVSASVASTEPVSAPVYLALGSNIGDRAANIHTALRLLQVQMYT
jgi:hypothetical protein